MDWCALSGWVLVLSLVPGAADAAKCCYWHAGVIDDTDVVTFVIVFCVWLHLLQAFSHSCEKDCNSYPNFSIRIHTGQVIGTLIGGLRITTNYVAETVDGRMSTFLRMGNDVGFKDGQKIHHTLLLPGESHYFVTLEGISVQGVRLQIDPGAFARTPDHNGGCLPNTGSPWTAIHRKEYDIVKSAMQAHFSAFHLEQVPGMFDLCYLNRNQQRLPYPCMTFHFHGADLTWSYPIIPANSRWILLHSWFP
ncbi:hypothetical protein IFM89_005913 [Coptis chinensis]|uniref:Xylanase inhibitor C-terminal domain-containing protein n=1 Tax=Coptis chinensis TaxID=261450 RepID=A0A835HU86_9MAGN|nr:hypothetical protein IFM89_005913 [Coptis chinensis]